jgi:hypothetical protein
LSSNGYDGIYIRYVDNQNDGSFNINRFPNNSNGFPSEIIGNDRNGIVINDSEVTIHNTIIMDNPSAGINFAGGTMDVQGNFIFRNSANGFYSGTTQAGILIRALSSEDTQVINNCIYNNDSEQDGDADSTGNFQIYHEFNSTLKAWDNYWGTTTTDVEDANAAVEANAIHDGNDSIGDGTVDYDPIANDSGTPYISCDSDVLGWTLPTIHSP